MQYCFHDYTLDPASREIWHGTHRLALEPKVFQVLLYLLEHRDRMLPKADLRLLGDIAVRREPPGIEPAESHYQQALTLAGELGMRPLQAHCHLRLGTLYARVSQREQAHAELSAAIDLYRAMGMTFWLPQAEAVLVQVVEA